jgi:hypothetical protein
MYSSVSSQIISISPPPFPGTEEAWMPKYIVLLSVNFKLSILILVWFAWVHSGLLLLFPDGRGWAGGGFLRGHERHGSLQLAHGYVRR